MINARGRVAVRDAGGAWVRFDSLENCPGCACSCAPGEKDAVYIPGLPIGETDVVLSLSTGNSLKLLVHSIVMPLAGFVGASLIARFFNAGDAVTVAASLAGMGLGIALCKTQSFNRIHFE